MNKKSIPQSRAKNKNADYNAALTALAYYYNKPTDKVIQHLYDKFGYSYQDVAKILNTSKQAVSKRFPKKEVSA